MVTCRISKHKVMLHQRPKLGGWGESSSNRGVGVGGDCEELQSYIVSEESIVND